MPWYDYKCTYCEHEEKDVHRKITENVAEYECPVCLGIMKQIIGNTTFDLIGDGWAKTGYSKILANKIKNSNAKEKTTKD